MKEKVASFAILPDISYNKPNGIGISHNINYGVADAQLCKFIGFLSEQRLSSLVLEECTVLLYAPLRNSSRAERRPRRRNTNELTERHDTHN